MKGKIFTIEEANRQLPLLTRIVDDIVSGYGEINKALADFEEAKKAKREEETQRLDAEVGTVLERFQALILEVEALGGTVKDYEQGFVDFYGEVDGEIVYFCWQRGESKISHYHKLEEGFSKRRGFAVNAA